MKHAKKYFLFICFFIAGCIESGPKGPVHLKCWNYDGKLVFDDNVKYVENRIDAWFIKNPNIEFLISGVDCVRFPTHNPEEIEQDVQ